MTNHWKGIALVAMGFSAGMAFAVACGGGKDGNNGFPGVAPALAQTASCSQWELAFASNGDLPESGAMFYGTAVRLLPEGWIPVESGMFMRCVD